MRLKKVRIRQKIRNRYPSADPDPKGKINAGQIHKSRTLFFQGIYLTLDKKETRKEQYFSVWWTPRIRIILPDPNLYTGNLVRSRSVFELVSTDPAPNSNRVG